jgi:hypothetical protein
MQILRRVIFFILTAGVALLFGLAGVIGADAIITKIFTPEFLAPPYSPFSLNLWVMLISWCIGVIISVTGICAILIMPLTFLCTSARKPFSWQAKPPMLQIRFLRWYSEKLKEYTDELDKNA